MKVTLYILMWMIFYIPLKSQINIDSLAKIEMNLKQQSIDKFYVPEVNKTQITARVKSEFYQKKEILKEQKLTEKIQRIKDQHPIVRLSAGDLSVAQEVLDTLEYGSIHNRRIYYHRLKTWTLPENLKPDYQNKFEQATFKAIYSGEKKIMGKAIRAMISNRMSNYQEIVETRIQEDNYYILPEVSEELGGNFNSKKTVIAIINSIYSKNYDQKEVWKLTKGLFEMYKISDESSAHDLYDFSEEVFTKSLLGVEDLEFEKYREFTYSSSNPYEYLFEIIKYSKTSKSLEFIKYLYSRDFKKKACLAILTQAKHESAKSLILNALKMPKSYFDVIQEPSFEDRNAFVNYYQNTNDDTMLKLVLSNFESSINYYFETTENPNEYFKHQMAEAVIKTLYQCNKLNKFEELKNRIKDQTLLWNCQLQFDGYSGITEDKIASVMIDLGLNTKNLTSKELRKRIAKEDIYGESILIKSLKYFNRLTTFNLEKGFLPIDYNEILTSLFNQSNNELNQLDFITEAKKIGDSYHYNIEILTPNFLYNFNARSLDDWVDVSSILFTLNQICNDQNIQNRFILIERDDPIAYIVYGDMEFKNKVNSILK